MKNISKKFLFGAFGALLLIILAYVGCNQSKSSLSGN